MFTLSLFGPFQLTDATGGPILLGAKSQALLALLATDRSGTRTRAFLRAMLWESSAPEHAAASLRGALSQLRGILNGEEEVLDANRERVSLRLDHVRIAEDGEGRTFLEGLDIAGLEAFEDWLTEMRSRRATVPASNIVPLRPETSPTYMLPRIAVIPFELRVHDPAQEIFGDILAEELTRILAGSTLMRVVSHLSTRRMSGRGQRITTLRQQLGCDYLISGSLVIMGAKSKLLVHFQDARAGTIIWTESFIEENCAIVLGESEVLLEIAQRAQRAVLSQGANDLEGRQLLTAPAFRLLIGGINNLHTHLSDSFDRARVYLEGAVAACPSHPLPTAWLGFWHWMSIQNGFSRDRDGASARSRMLAAEAIDRDPACAVARATVAMNYSHILHDFELAAQAYETARKWAPNEPLNALLNGAMLAYLGRGAEAVGLTEQARALSPLDPQKYYLDLLTGTAHLTNDEPKAALGLAMSSLALNPNYASTHRLKIISLAAMGSFNEARAAGRDYLKIDPDFTVSRYARNHAAFHGVVGSYWADMLRVAGLPK